MTVKATMSVSYYINGLFRQGNAQDARTYLGAGPATSSSRTIVFCAGFTPAGAGADVAQLVVPYGSDGITVLTYDVVRLTLRVATAGGAPSVKIERSTVTGAFAAADVGTVTLGLGAFEGAVTAGLGQVNSGDKLRMNVLDIATALNWTVALEMMETP